MSFLEPFPRYSPHKWVIFISNKISTKQIGSPKYHEFQEKDLGKSLGISNDFLYIDCLIGQFVRAKNAVNMENLINLGNGFPRHIPDSFLNCFLKPLPGFETSIYSKFL